MRGRCDLWKMKKFRVSSQGLFIRNHLDTHFQLVGSTVIPGMRPQGQPRWAGNDRGELWLR